MKRKKMKATLCLLGSLMFVGGELEASEKGEVMKKNKKLVVNTPLEEVREIHSYYSNPENVVMLQMANEKTMSVWQNMSSYFPTSQILRDGAISNLPLNLDSSIGELNFKTTKDAKSRTVNDFFEKSNMDSIIVIQNGEVKFEQYKTMRERDKHNWFSVGKTIPGTLIALLAEEGKLDMKNPVSTYIPELKGSEWYSVTVEQTMDMTTGLNSTEHDEKEEPRLNPESGWYRWAVSIGLFSGENKEEVYDVLSDMKRDKSAYTSFEYNSINTFVLETIVENVSGKSLAETFSDKVWSKVGMQNDAYVAITPDAHTMSFGLASSTLRDLGRFGMIYTPSWDKITDEKIISDKIIKEIQTGGNKEIYNKGAVGKIMVDAFHEDSEMANRYQWDAVFTDGDFFKGGVGGQGLYISPSDDIVIAWFATGTEHHEETMARAIAKGIKKHQNN
ncbi:MAG: serine hydrolase domain-containing protein [Psychrilyobacter sp.]|uniref:serine hydrolase domain-containing protein n=1 Tax=Psychrilyobacter sp. TaxID=2586924 RepID=UPI003C73844C